MQMRKLSLFWLTIFENIMCNLPLWGGGGERIIDVGSDLLFGGDALGNLLES
jgi:hypothetical protein